MNALNAEPEKKPPPTQILVVTPSRAESKPPTKKVAMDLEKVAVNLEKVAVDPKLSRLRRQSPGRPGQNRLGYEISRSRLGKSRRGSGKSRRWTENSRHAPGESAVKPKLSRRRRKSPGRPGKKSPSLRNKSKKIIGKSCQEHLKIRRGPGHLGLNIYV